MILADTGFFLALLDARDDLHGRAVAWAGHVEDRLLVTEYVLWETVNFASAPANRAKVHALVGQVPRPRATRSSRPRPTCSRPD